MNSNDSYEFYILLILLLSFTASHNNADAHNCCTVRKRDFSVNKNPPKMCPWNSFNFIQFSLLKDREKLFTLQLIKVKRHLYRQFSQNSTFYRENENVEFGVFRHFWLFIQVGMKVPFVCTTAWTSLSADFWNFSQPHFCRKNRICRWVWALKIGGIVRPDFPR